MPTEIDEGTAVPAKTIMSILLHWPIVILLGSVMVVTFYMAHLPLRFDWGAFLPSYWIGLTLRSIVGAGLLYLIHDPRQIHFKWLALMTPVYAWLIYWFGFNVGGLLAVASIAIAEYFTRRPAAGVWRIFVPGLYLFFGLVCVLGLSTAIVILRPSFDGMFMRIDKILLLGTSVPELSQWLLARMPEGSVGVLDWIYFSMFSEVGGVLILLALLSTKTEVHRYVGSLLVAHVLALILFGLRPCIGPFYICVDHFHHFPSGIDTYTIQAATVDKMRFLTSGGQLSMIGMDYFIGFPSMHIAQPTIATIFAWKRGWRRITTVLVAYNIVLILAILALEWHYLIDIVGGLAVAPFATRLASIQLKLPRFGFRQRLALQ